MTILGKGFFFLLCFFVSTIVQAQHHKTPDTSATDPAYVFRHPPEAAKPGVLWMWMGSNISKEGITKDLEALKRQGFNRTTMFSLADVTTPWAGDIGNSPTPAIISWTEPWWKLVRHAAIASKRLGMDFGTFNGPGYATSGGTWITPQYSMQEISFSKTAAAGNAPVNMMLHQPQVNPRAHQYFPVYNPETGLVEKPVVEARKTYYRDIAVLALPDTGVVAKEAVIDLSGKMQPDGHLTWDAPAGNWIIYRFGHTTMGSLIQPAQWKATGLECDKMSQEAVDFHIDHVIAEIQSHLGDLIGTGFTHVHFDSYEAGFPTWTPKMKEAFQVRRGYDLTPYLATFAGRTIGNKQDSIRFRNDFDATIKDLYRDVYFSTLSKKLKAAHLNFLCEPYGGPWRQPDIMPLIDIVMTEFWTHGGNYSPYELDATVAALRQSGQQIIEAEAFTGDPKDSKWSETPAWIKPMGDAAFCAGVNRFILHRFVQQPWDDRYRPGATMGQWGTHFDRTQTWWKPGKALVDYWHRCQALLQWGTIVLPAKDDFTVADTAMHAIQYLHRKQPDAEVYFVANTCRKATTANCSFAVTGMQPELWDAVTGSMRILPEFEDHQTNTSIPLRFDEAQSFFIVFRKKTTAAKATGTKNFPVQQEVQTIDGSWQVQFDPQWGGPLKPVHFAQLQDWTARTEKGIRYFSGTAVYKKSFDAPAARRVAPASALFLHLGTVQHIARVRLNGKDLGVVWTAPWQVQLPRGLLKTTGNLLQIEVTNVWANRLIGDEQEPPDCQWLPGHMGSGDFLKTFPEWFINHQPRPSKGRYCFTTWNYFTRESPLIPSGLLGPVKIMKE